MLVLTISRCHESGRVEPLVAINDLLFVRSVLASVRTIAIGEEDEDSNPRTLTVVGKSRRGSDRSKLGHPISR